MKAAAKVARGRILLTGRTDNFLQGRPDIDDTIRRLVAFAEVGANVLYAPYPTDMDAVRAIARAVAPKPVNLVVGTMNGTEPWAEVQAAGVKRLSLGVCALHARHGQSGPGCDRTPVWRPGDGRRRAAFDHFGHRLRPTPREDEPSNRRGVTA